jgi:hypothetical protein
MFLIIPKLGRGSGAVITEILSTQLKLKMTVTSYEADQSTSYVSLFQNRRNNRMQSALILL